MNLQEQLFSAAEWLNGENNRGYGPKPLPQPRDAEITELLRRWEALEEPTRAEAASHLLRQQTGTLLAYGERMASLAVRQQDSELIYFGLLAVGIDDWKVDFRDNITIVAPLYDAALRIGCDPSDIFHRAANILPESAAAGLRGFLVRDEASKSLKAFRYVVVSDSDGFRYEQTW